VVPSHKENTNVVAVRFAVRKVFLGGATMGAVALAAASTAWACSPGATSILSAQAVPANGLVEVMGRGFDPQYGPIEIRWNHAAFGSLLGTVEGATFTKSVTVPPKVPGDYFIYSVQRKADGSLQYWTAAPIQVLSPEASAPPPTNPPASTIPSPVTTPENNQTPATSAVPILVPEPAVPVAQPGPRGIQATVPAGPRAQPIPALATDVAGQSQPALVPTSPPPDSVSSTTNTPYVDDGLPATVEGLWSGLDDADPPTLGTSLTEPRGADGPSPLGISLILAGLLGLGAGASTVLSAKRRRVTARSR
jgi:hypothetical protein